MAKVRLFCLLQAGVLLAAAPLAAAPPRAGSVIKKCQDAQGRWHYGDTAAAECATSRVTDIDEEGRKIGEIAAPPTPGERKARREQERKEVAATAQADQQQVEDRRLLRAYENETAVLRARDRRLAHIDRTMGGNGQLLANIRVRVANLEKEAGGGQPSAELVAARRQVVEYEAANDELKHQRKGIADQFERELAAWRAAWDRAQGPALASDLAKPPLPPPGDRSK